MCQCTDIAACAAASSSSSLQCGNYVRQAARRLTELVAIQHRIPARKVAVGIVIGLALVLFTLYFTSAGFRRTLQFWNGAAPLLIQYRWIRFKSRYIDRCTDEAELKQRMDQFHQRVAPQVADFILEMGGIFIKFGQVMSTVGGGLLNPAYMEVLKPLQDGVPPKGIQEIKRIVERSTGKTMQELFLSFEEKPIGAASIGQAHRAVLKRNNETIVVKVQYEEVAQLFATDFNNLELAVRLTNSKNKDVVHSIRRRHENELDFRKEAANLKEITRNMQAHGVEPNLVRIPRVIDELCTEHVLGLEYLDGISLSKAIELEQDRVAFGLGMNSAVELKENLSKRMMEHFARGGGGVESDMKLMTGRNTKLLELAGPLAVRVLSFYGGVKEFAHDLVWNLQMGGARFAHSLRKDCDDTMWTPASQIRRPPSANKGKRINLNRAIKTLVHVHGLQMIKDGVFNADPHPGNVLILPDGRLGLLDYGMVSRLSEHERMNVARTVLALSRRNNQKEVAEIYLQEGYRAKWKEGEINDENILHRFATFHLDRLDLSPVTLKTTVDNGIDVDGRKIPIVQILRTTIETSIPLWVEHARRLSALLVGTGTQAARPLSLAKAWRSIAEEAVLDQSRSMKSGNR